MRFLPDLSSAFKGGCKSNYIGHEGFVACLQLFPMGMEKPHGRKAVIQVFGTTYQSAKALFQSPCKAVVVKPVL